MRITSLILVTYAALGYAKPILRDVGSEISNALRARSNLPTRSSNGSDGSHDSGTLQDCLASKDVPVYFPLSPEFSQLAEPYNLRLVYTPAVIVLPTTNQQVADAVVCAGKSDVKVQAKSGGHSYASYSSGGQNGSMIIDLQEFQDIKLDSNGVANVGAGVRLGDLALSLYNQSKRALPHGTCPGVGLGGHATHGGYGYTSRQWGLTLDTVIGTNVVLANGSYVHTSPTEYPDIHYTLLGAADSFGIVTSFEMQTEPAPDSVVNWAFSFSGMYTDANTAAAALEHIQAFSLNYSIIDGKLAFGIHLDSASTFSVSGTYLGPAEHFNNTIAPALLSSLPTPSTTTIQSVDWLTSLTLLAAPQPLAQPTTTYDLHDDFYAKSITVPESSPLTYSSFYNYIDYIITQGLNPANPNPWFSIINLYGGPDSAINAVPASKTAYSDRSALWVVQHYGYTAPPDASTPYPESSIDFVNGLNEAFTEKMPGTAFGAYLNYVDPSLSAEEAHRLYYGEETYERLRAIKEVVDPKGVFWNPQAVGN